MDQAKTYMPNAGSLADRVCKFFADNPSEEMSPADIAIKFEASSKHNIKTLLGQCLAHDYLVLARDDDLEWVYGPGPKIHLYKPQPEAPATVVPCWPATEGEEKPTTTPRRSPTKPTPLILDNITIDDGIPLHAIEHRPEALARFAVMSNLLSKMAPKQSAGLPLDAYATLTKAMTAAHKAGTARFAIRKSKATRTLRVWRVS